MHVKLRDWIELAVLPLVTAGVWILWDMNQNINRLNIQVGVIIAEAGPTKDILKDHEYRIRAVEKELLDGKGNKGN